MSGRGTRVLLPISRSFPDNTLDPHMLMFKGLNSDRLCPAPPEAGLQFCLLESGD